MKIKLTTPKPSKYWKKRVGLKAVGKYPQQHRRWQIYQFHKEMDDINKLLSSRKK